MQELFKKKCYDIFFTDINGTLIDGINDEDGKIITTFEQDLEKQKRLSNFFNLILEGNNIIVVVSSTHHGDMRRKFKNIDMVIDDKNKKKILYFMSDKHRSLQEFENIDKCMYEGIEITLVKNKLEAVNKVLGYFKESNTEVGRIYGIGDSVDDIDMLLRIKELGGITGLVADENEIRHITTGYDGPSLITHENIEKVANEIAGYEFRLDRQIFIEKYKKIYGAEYLKQIRISDELKMLQKSQNNRALEIKEKFLQGDFSRDDLVKLGYLSSLAFNYVQKKVITENNGIIYYDKDKYNEILKIGENISTHVLERQPSILLESSFVKLFNKK